ncbi:UBA domain-containing protein [Balamuthia mandrillaris]
MMEKRKGKGKAKGKGNAAALNVPFGIVAASSVKPKECVPDQLYQNCASLKQQKQILTFLFDPAQWMRWWQTYEFNPSMKQSMRLLVQIGTIDAVLRGKYFLPDGTGVLLNKKQMEKACLSSRMYASDHFKARSKKSSAGSTTSTTSTTYMVVEGDCLEAAIWLKDKSGLACNPAVLNMASRSHPCGGYRSGAGAQEENLARRTNLFQCLEDPYKIDSSRSWSYPLPEFGGVYSPRVCVFRSAESHGYAFMQKPDFLSIISAFAYKSPPLDIAHDGEEPRLSGSIVKHVQHKISAILNIALDNGHDSIVLSAFGCGAYGNPPTHTAQLFKQVILSSFANCFKVVMFAIYEDHNSGKEHNPIGNVKPFAEVFGVPVMRLSELLSEREGAERDEEKENKEGGDVTRQNDRGQTGSNEPNLQQQQGSNFT